LFSESVELNNKAAWQHRGPEGLDTGIGRSEAGLGDTKAEGAVRIQCWRGRGKHTEAGYRNWLYQSTERGQDTGIGRSEAGLGGSEAEGAVRIQCWKERGARIPESWYHITERGKIPGLAVARQRDREADSEAR
jgi:hypothetical protein